MVLAGPFSSVSLFITDKISNKWVNTLIKGVASLVQLKDVGAPICVIRIWQESEMGHVGNLIYEQELAMNFTMEKLTGNFTAVSSSQSGQFFGFYFNKGVSDCSIFNMHLTDVHELLQVDDFKRQGIKEVANKRKIKVKNAQIELVKSINMDVLIKGTGSAEH